MRTEIVVVANYLLDKQISMERYCSSLCTFYSGYRLRILRPKVFLGRFFADRPLLNKQLRYIDKYILFIPELLVVSIRCKLVHVCDHSNSPYILFLPRRKTVVTCHDLIAVRGAFGDSSVHCNSTPMGKVLQFLILLSLQRASSIIFVSHTTKSDYLLLAKGGNDQNLKVIYNCLDNSSISFLPKASRDLSRLQSLPYLLTVGSSLPRKNRKLALKLLQLVNMHFPFQLVVVGSDLSIQEKQLTDDLSLGDAIVHMGKVSQSELSFIYRNAYCLVFPSYSEGFGWPVIEAQSFGCPVIASSSSCIPEIGGSGALYADPYSVSDFLIRVQSLTNPDLRERLISRGFRNQMRFNPSYIKDQYINAVSPWL